MYVVARKEDDQCKSHVHGKHNPNINFVTPNIEVWDSGSRTCTCRCKPTKNKPHIVKILVKACVFISGQKSTAPLYQLRTEVLPRESSV